MAIPLWKTQSTSLHVPGYPLRTYVSHGQRVPSQGHEQEPISALTDTSQPTVPHSFISLHMTQGWL